MNIYDQLDHSLDGCPQKNYTIFSLLINYAKNKYLQKKRVKYKKNKHFKSKWMTKGLLNSINTKDRLYKMMVQTSTDSVMYEPLRANLKAYQRILKNSINEAKRVYHHNLFARYKSDIKKTWSIIKDTLGKKNVQKKDTSEFIINNKTITNPAEVANEFNKYFVSIGQTLSRNVQSNRSYDEYLVENTNCQLIFNPVNEEMVAKIINQLKNKSSYGHDGISNILIKQSQQCLTKSLTLIINQCLRSGCFPYQLKLSKVRPVYKSSDTKMFNNYRPISLLPSMSKIFEYVIFHQTMAYFNDNKLLCSNQFGFRPKRSTELAALKLINHLISELDKNNSPTNIYIDLSKAFDTLDHLILLNKLKYYGVTGAANLLFQNYLSNRQQYVEYNGATSQKLKISTGVPQGSILGPLLFLIYINDLPSVSNVLQMLMYADDTTLYCNFNSINDVNRINEELCKVSAWLSANKLALNVAETKYIMFRTINKRIQYPEMKLNNIAIERVSKFKFLGIWLDEYLNWNQHISHISIKLSRINGTMSRLKQICPQSILMMIYNTLSLPHLNYGILLWGAKVKKDQKLHLLQKKSMRIITSQHYRSHSEPIFKNLGLLMVHDLYYMAIIKFYYNMMNGHLPDDFNCFKPHTSISCTRYPIRNPIMQYPFIKHEYARYALNYQLIRVINGNTDCFSLSNPLNNSILEKATTHSFYGYKVYAKTMILASYREACNIVDCYTCNNL